MGNSGRFTEKFKSPYFREMEAVFRDIGIDSVWMRIPSGLWWLAGRVPIYPGSQNRDPGHPDSVVSLKPVSFVLKPVQLPTTQNFSYPRFQRVFPDFSFL